MTLSERLYDFKYDLKSFLRQLTFMFIDMFPEDFRSDAPIADSKVGRPIKPDALRRNVAYQSMMKQRRRMEKRAKALADSGKPVSQPDELAYLQLCREIESIRESVNGNK